MNGLKRLQKRTLALFMALVLCLSLLPATAMAEENITVTDEGASPTEFQEEEKKEESDEEKLEQLELAILTVTWYDEDGLTELGTATFKEGEAEPPYPHEHPIKIADEENTYTFDHWEKFDDGESDIAYKAAFTAVPIAPTGDEDTSNALQPPTDEEEDGNSNEEEPQGEGDAQEIYGTMTASLGGVELTDGGGVEIAPANSVNLLVNLTFSDVNAVKSLTITLPLGMRLPNGQNGGQGARQDIKSHTWEKLPDCDFDGYQPNTGTLTYTFIDSVIKTGVSVPVQMDSVLWDGRAGTTVEDGIQIEASMETEDGRTWKETLTVDVSASKDIDRGIIFGDGKYDLPMAANRDFSLRLISLVDRVTSVENKRYYKELTLEIPIPQDTATGDYAKFRRLDTADSNLSSKMEDNIVVDEEHHIVTLKLKDSLLSGGQRWITPVFYWATDRAPENAGKTVTASGEIKFIATYYVGEPVEYTLDAVWPYKLIPDEEKFRVGYGTNGASRYNWYDIEPELVHWLDRFTLKYDGMMPSTSKKIAFDYQCTDMIGIVSQVIPVMPGPVKVRCTTNKGRTLPEGGYKEYPNNTATEIRISASEMGLESDEYFTHIEAFVETGYSVGYFDQYLFTYGKILRSTSENNEAVVCKDFATMTVSDPENPDTIFASNSRSVTIHSDISRAIATASVDSKITSKDGLIAGEPATMHIDVGSSACLGNYFPRQSEYIQRPIIYVRLPNTISITDISIAGIDKSHYELTEPHPLEDGYHVYGIHFKDNSGAVYLYINDKLEKKSLSIDLTLWVSLKNSVTSLSKTKTVFVTNEAPQARTRVDQSALLVEDTYGVDFLRTEDEGPLIVSWSGTWNVQPAVKGLMAYNKAEDRPGMGTTPDGAELLLLGADNRVAYELIAWNNTPSTQSADTLSGNDFCYYIPVPKADTPLRGGANGVSSAAGYSLALTGPVEQEDNFFLFSYNTEASTQTGTWQTADEMDGNWSDVKMIRVTVNPYTNITVAPQGTKTVTFPFRTEDPDALKVGDTVRFNGYGTSFGTSYNGVESVWTMAIKPTEIQVAGSVSGTVKQKDYATGGEDRPLANVVVTLRDSDGEVVDTAATGSDGSYAFENLLEDGEYTVTAANPDNQNLRFLGGTGTEEVFLGSGAARFPTVDFVLEVPHTVTFVVDGPEGTYTVTGDEAQKIWHGDKVTAWPTVEPITGYQRGTWTPAQDTPITQDTEFKIVVSDHLAKYTVEHYRENLEGGGYTLAETEPLDGRVGDTVTTQAKAYEGFTWKESAEGTLTSGTVAADDSLVLKLYYTRNEYQVKYEYTGEVPARASALPEAASCK